MEQPRRLCMVVHGYYPLDPRVARAARAARDSGWAVDVVAMRDEGEPPEEVVDGVDVMRLPFRHDREAGVAGLFAEYLGFTLAATLALARRSRRYAIVHVHNPPDFLMVATVVPKLRGARVVFDVHDLSPDMFDMRFRGRRGARVAEHIMRLVERLATGFADAVVTVHEPYRDELVSRGVRRKKTCVVMNTVDQSVMPEASATAPNGFRIVYHGTVTPHYGVDLLVEAFAAIARDVPDARLEIYGDGDALAGVHAAAERLEVAERLLTSDRMVPQREVLALVEGASVGVIPNRPTRLNRYALSSKLFEYVVLGVPVVCAGLPTLRAHFDDREVLFFAPGDSASLAAALRAVAADPAAATARVVAARARYDAEYGWTANSERYSRLLARLHGRHLAG